MIKESVAQMRITSIKPAGRGFESHHVERSACSSAGRAAGQGASSSIPRLFTNERSRGAEKGYFMGSAIRGFESHRPISGVVKWFNTADSKTPSSTFPGFIVNDESMVQERGTSNYRFESCDKPRPKTVCFSQRGLVPRLSVTSRGFRDWSRNAASNPLTAYSSTHN